MAGIDSLFDGGEQHTIFLIRHRGRANGNLDYARDPGRSVAALKNETSRARLGRTLER